MRLRSSHPFLERPTVEAPIGMLGVAPPEPLDALNSSEISDHLRESFICGQLGKKEIGGDA
jgi:hypothetical protein